MLTRIPQHIVRHSHPIPLTILPGSGKQIVTIYDHSTALRYWILRDLFHIPATIRPCCGSVIVAVA